MSSKKLLLEEPVDGDGQPLRDLAELLAEVPRLVVFLDEGVLGQERPHLRSKPTLLAEVILRLLLDAIILIQHLQVDEPRLVLGPAILSLNHIQNKCCYIVPTAKGYVTTMPMRTHRASHHKHM